MTVSAVSPWRTALQGDACLPASVFGPVLLSALRRLASICLSEVMARFLAVSKRGQLMNAAHPLSGHFKLEPKRTHHFQYACEFWITLLRQRLVKALPAKTRSLRDFCHALCAGNIAQSGRHQARIAILERGF